MKCCTSGFCLFNDIVCDHVCASQHVTRTKLWICAHVSTIGSKLNECMVTMCVINIKNLVATKQWVKVWKGQAHGLWASIGNWWYIVSNSKLKGCWMRPKANARICWMKPIAKACNHLLTISCFLFQNHYSSCINLRFEMVRLKGHHWIQILLWFQPTCSSQCHPPKHCVLKSIVSTFEFNRL